jgi:hypothetical protein
VHDEYALCESEHLIQIRRVDHDGHAGIARCTDACVHRRSRLHVESARWILRHQCGLRPVDLPSDHQFLLVAARERASQSELVTSSYVVVADERPGPFAEVCPTHDAAPGACAEQRDVVAQ